MIGAALGAVPGGCVVTCVDAGMDTLPQPCRSSINHRLTNSTTIIITPHHRRTSRKQAPITLDPPAAASATAGAPASASASAGAMAATTTTAGGAAKSKKRGRGERCV